MLISARHTLLRASTTTAFVVCAALLAGCGAPSSSKGMTHPKRSKEYFAESEYGVKASPRVSNKRSNLPRGGGRDQLGKPYKVRGKMYYPREDKNYRKIGGASWYGDAFHGRLTANGEIYDMTHLTAAHPTMPLPSYAKVTNLKNGSSVIVRVNDRGPYHSGRIIDLSRRAAELLDYTHTGTARVQVEYVGRAPLDGRDDRFLMASYRPGVGIDPSDGLASGVMVAMAGPSPRRAPPGAGADSAAFPSAPIASAAPIALAEPAYPPAPGSERELLLPSLGPVVSKRPTPSDAVPETIPFGVAGLSYAPERAAASVTAFAGFDDAAAAALSDPAPYSQPATGIPYVAAGTFQDRAAAERLAKILSGFGLVEIGVTQADGGTWFSVDLYSQGGVSLDELLAKAWAHGAPDALAVRD